MSNIKESFRGVRINRLGYTFKGKVIQKFLTNPKF